MSKYNILGLQAYCCTTKNLQKEKKYLDQEMITENFLRNPISQKILMEKSLNLFLLIRKSHIEQEQADSVFFYNAITFLPRTVPTLAVRYGFGVFNTTNYHPWMIPIVFNVTVFCQRIVSNKLLDYETCLNIQWDNLYGSPSILPNKSKGFIVVI